MGGEKLKSFRPYWALFFAGLITIAGIFGNSFTLSAQTVDSSPVTNESSIILGETPAAPPASSGDSSVMVMLRMILVLALAALAIYGVVFFIKRLARPREVLDPHLKVLARIPLSNDSFAAVISLGAKAWLVGGGSGGVNLISEVDDVESLETMLLDDARRSAEAGNRRLLDFGSLIRRLGGRSGNAEPPGNSSFADSLRKKRERLKGL